MPSSFFESDRKSIQFVNGFPDAEKDADFDSMYPETVRRQSPCHWSPVRVCRLAATLLVKEPGTRVLDIGCGPGKFCVVGSGTTLGHFTGVEQRKRLVRAAREVIQQWDIPRVDIVHGNIMDIDFRAYDAFYLFNPFEENVFPPLRIDFEVDLEPVLYSTYAGHVREQLARMPPLTRVVTYCGEASEIPTDYVCEKTAFGSYLKLWVKKNPPESNPKDARAAEGSSQIPPPPHPVSLTLA